MKNAIAVINGGSSSIKFSLFLCTDKDDLELLCSGQAEGIRVAPHFEAKDASGKLISEKKWENSPDTDHEFLMDHIIGWIGENYADIEVKAVGHRVVHGSNLYSAPVQVDETVLKNLEQFIPLAPLHQPHNLGPIRIIAKYKPELLQVACFDTAFHSAQPDEARNFAIPRELTQEGIRRYGFHGLSYEYIAMKFREIAPDIAKGRVVVAHLGSGASMCAVKDGRSIASTMGFSALDGLPMGTRTGAMDPAVVLYFMQEKGMNASEIETLLYKKSGLLGVSGISNDMRVLLKSRDPRAEEAVNLFVYRINRELGSLMAALNGLDALIFTAGIGENSAEIRQRVCLAAAWAGISPDSDANRNSSACITTSDSPVSAWIIPTNEEKMIAMHTRSLMNAAGKNCSELSR
ncbi:MAG: acetate/propionate family kinase [Desulfococcaceae bacterium]